MSGAILGAVEQCQEALGKERENRKNAFVNYLSALPSRLKEMDEKKAAALFPYSVDEAKVIFQKLASEPSTELTNPTIMHIIEVLRVEIHTSLRELSTVREFVTLSLPKHESGNLVGVGVMEYVIKSVDVSLEKLSSYATDLPEYFSKRAESLDRIGVEHSEENESTVTEETLKTSDPKKDDEKKSSTKEEKTTTKRQLRTNKDYEAYIIAYDVEWYCQLGRVWDEVRSIHACVTDLITKNIKYVVDPKNDSSSGHMMY